MNFFLLQYFGTPAAFTANAQRAVPPGELSRTTRREEGRGPAAEGEGLGDRRGVPAQGGGEDRRIQGAVGLDYLES